MKFVILILFFLFLTSANSQTESIFVDYNPFEFSSPRDSDFSYFTAEELKELQKSNIDKVIVTIDDMIDGDKVEFLFNNNFYLSKQNYYSYRKGESTLEWTKRFNIDSTYRLIATEKAVFMDKIEYDSLSYDEIGRLIYKERSVRVWSKKTKQYILESSIKLEVLELDNDKVILLNSKDGSKSYINNKNELFKYEIAVRTDSISEFMTEDSVRIKSFWYKYALGSEFKIGFKQEYNGELLIKETLYNYYVNYGILKQYKHFIYNTEGQLIQSYRDDMVWDVPYDKKLYIYKNESIIDITFIGYKASKFFHFDYIHNIILR